MNKKTMWLIALMLTSLTLMISLGIFHASEAEQIDQELLKVKSVDQTIELSLEQIMAFDKVIFEANVKSSGNDPILTQFGGVLLQDVLVAQGIVLEGSETVVFKAVDGYQTSVLAQEVLQPNNIYIVYERNGEKTKSRADGGTGPLEIVIALDPFSQRWNKFLVEIEIRP